MVTALGAALVADLGVDLVAVLALGVDFVTVPALAVFDASLVVPDIFEPELRVTVTLGFCAVFVFGKAVELTRGCAFCLV